MPTIKVTDATAEPISLAEAKAHLRVDSADDDALINALITAARQDAEHIMGRTLLPTTWQLNLDAFPADWVELLYPNLLTVVHVKYVDVAGTLQTVDPADYLIDTFSQPGGIAPAPGKAWPVAQDRINAVQVQYTAGWANAAAVPAVIKAWLKVRVGQLYEHREQIIAGAAVSTVPYVDGLLDPYRVWRL